MCIGNFGVAPPADLSRPGSPAVGYCVVGCGLGGEQHEEEQKEKEEVHLLIKSSDPKPDGWGTIQNF